MWNIAAKFLASLFTPLISKWMDQRESRARGRLESEAKAMEEVNARIKEANSARAKARRDNASDPDGQLRDDGFRRD